MNHSVHVSSLIEAIYIYTPSQTYRRDGWEVGFLLGLSVPDLVGLEVGSMVGHKVGSEDAFLLGLFVGALVGRTVGSLVGAVGRRVAIGVGL